MSEEEALEGSDEGCFGFVNRVRVKGPIGEWGGAVAVEREEEEEEEGQSNENQGQHNKWGFASCDLLSSHSRLASSVATHISVLWEWDYGPLFQLLIYVSVCFTRRNLVFFVLLWPCNYRPSRNMDCH